MKNSKMDFEKLSEEQKNIIGKEKVHMLINGVAGNGKSTTLLYKMIKIMMSEKKRQKMLYITFDNILVSDTKRRALMSPEFIEYKDCHDINICTFHSIAYEILSKIGFKGLQKMDSNIDTIGKLNDSIYAKLYSVWEKYTNEQSDTYKELKEDERLSSFHDVNFLRDEILWMKANGYIKKEDYLKSKRNGRPNAPKVLESQMNTIYNIFLEHEEKKTTKYNENMDLEDYALKLFENFSYISKENFFDYVFVDEAQDMQVMQLRVLAKLAKKSIIIAGDLKERIFEKNVHSYERLGFHIEDWQVGSLTKIFRSTKEIAKLANSLKFTDIENKTIADIENMVNGDRPEIRYYRYRKDEILFLIDKIKDIHMKEKGATIAVIHREEKKVLKGQKTIIQAQLEAEFNLIGVKNYSKNIKKRKNPIFYIDIYSAKGLEFDYVFIVDFDKEHYPLKEKIDALCEHYKKQNVASNDYYDKDFGNIINEEKRLLYLAITRAKENVFFLYSGGNEKNSSPFIKEFNTNDYEAYGFNKEDDTEEKSKAEKNLLNLFS